MIRGHRRRHRLVFTVLPLVLLPAVAAALLLRDPEPVVPQLPEPLRAPELGGEPIPNGSLTWTGTELNTTLLRDGSGLLVELNKVEALAIPDPLLYWSAEPASIDGPLPDAAVLLSPIGADPTRRLRLPPEAAGPTGSLVIYSLAHQSVKATAPLAGATP